METSGSDAARYNDAVKVWCADGCNGSSIYQDLDLAVRAPSLMGATVEYGARIARASGSPAGTGSVYLWQYRDAWSPNGSDSIAFTAGHAWPSADGSFVNSSARIKPDTKYIRLQIYIDNAATHYVLDDAFVIRAN